MIYEEKKEKYKIKLYLYLNLRILRYSTGVVNFFQKNGFPFAYAYKSRITSIISNFYAFLAVLQLFSLLTENQYPPPSQYPATTFVSRTCLINKGLIDQVFACQVSPFILSF